MNKANDSVFKNSIWNLFGGAISLLVGFLSIPYAIKGLGKDGFGILTIAWVILGYFGLFDLGFSQATTKYAAGYLSKGRTDKVTSVFWVSLITSLSMGFVGSIILFVFTPLLTGRILSIPTALLNDAQNSFMILSGVLPFIIATTSLKGILAASNRFDLLNKIQAPSNILTYIIPCSAFVFGSSLTVVIILISVMRFLIFFIYLYYSFLLHPYLSKKVLFEKEIFKNMLGFGGWISLSNFVSPLLVYLDRFLIGSLLSVSLVSFYTVPYELVIRARLFPNAIVDSVFPKFSSIVIGKEVKKTAELFLKPVKYISIALGFVVFILVTYSYEILTIWLGNSYADTSSILLQILSIGLFFNGIATVPFFFLQGVGKPDIPAKFHVLELLVFGCMFFFMIKYFGLIGAAITWTSRATFDFILLFIATYSIEREIFSGHIFDLVVKLFILLFVFIVISFGIHFYIPSILIKIILSLLTLAACFYVIWKSVLDEEERAFFMGKFRSFYSKFFIL